MKCIMEARAGIEPAYTDLQSAASPLCHRANVESLLITISKPNAKYKLT